MATISNEERKSTPAEIASAYGFLLNNKSHFASDPTRVSTDHLRLLGQTILQDKEERHAIFYMQVIFSRLAHRAVFDRTRKEDKKDRADLLSLFQEAANAIITTGKSNKRRELFGREIQKLASQAESYEEGRSDSFDDVQISMQDTNIFSDVQIRVQDSEELQWACKTIASLAVHFPPPKDPPKPTGRVPPERGRKSAPRNGG